MQVLLPVSRACIQLFAIIFDFCYSFKLATTATEKKWHETDMPRTYFIYYMYPYP